MRTKTLLILFLLLFLTSCEPPSNISIGCDVTELINAINTANSDPDHTNIFLDPGCPYDLISVDNYSLGYGNIDIGGTGLPKIITSITIEGNGATIQRQSAAPDFRIFYVDNSGDLIINDLSIINGAVQGNPYNYGGGIYVNYYGTLSLNNTQVMDSYSEKYGGGIYNDQGLVTINNSFISSNEAEWEGGGIFNYRGTVNIEGNSLITNNIATLYNGGGIYSKDGELSILSSQVSQNTAGAEGGAVKITLVMYSSTLSLEGVTFENNTANQGGGAIMMIETTFTITNCTFLNNQDTGLSQLISYGGGAIYLRDSPGTIDGGSLFEGNFSGGRGGGRSASV